MKIYANSIETGVFMATYSKKLEGEVAFVTGASRSLGAAIAKRLAADGAVVVQTAGWQPSPQEASRVRNHVCGKRSLLWNLTKNN